MNRKSLVVEYLLIKRQIESFLDSEDSFLKFLEADSSFHIFYSENKITFKSPKGLEIEVDYQLESNIVPSKEERYFKLTLLCQEQDKLKEFDLLTQQLENLIFKLGDEIEVNKLWSDISRQYSIEGYSLINEVENLLRRLIANFMLINVGYDWPKSHVPSNVESRDPELKNNYSDYLHQIYFSDLKKILFEGQRDFHLRNIGDIQKIVERYIKEKKDVIQIEHLEGVVSKSLWEKYFAKDIENNKKFLEEDLEKLNKLRNEIAHNTNITRKKLGQIQNLSKRIIETLKLEIEDLPNKKLSPEEQKFQVNTENFRIAKENPSLQCFLAERAVFEWYQLKFGESNIKSFGNILIDSGIDMIIRVSGKNRIGVQVRCISRKEFKLAINLLYFGADSFFDFSRFKLEYNRNFKEYHLVIVFNDYELGGTIPSSTELSSTLLEKDPPIRLILGFVNEEGNFEQILDK